jgi:uncharacterized protein GlcG (DUF336 family)
MITVPRLTLEDARLIMDAAEAKARAIGVDMDIAITDDGGHLIMFHRMDHARITSIEIAVSKAFTAAGARRSTRDYAHSGQPGGPAYGIHTSHQGRFTIFPGGLPIVVDGHVVGAVGCSSGHSDQDEAVAQAGIDAFQKEVSR